MARDAQAKLVALIVAQIYLSVHPSVCPSVCLSATACHAYVRSIARREPHRLPACWLFLTFLLRDGLILSVYLPTPSMYVSHDDDDDGDGDQKCQLLVNFFYAILFILAADYCISPTTPMLLVVCALCSTFYVLAVKVVVSFQLFVSTCVVQLVGKCCRSSV